MANLFKAAKESGTKPSAKKEKEEIVITDKDFHTTLHRLAEVNSKIDELAAESKILSEDVRQRAITEFAKDYEDKGKFTGSFNIRATGAKGKSDASLMFLPTDRYITIDEERYNELNEQYGDIAEENTTYTMDSALIEKYGDVISELISKCKAIDEKDKAKLISATTKYNVKKGTISRIPELVTEDFETVLSDIRPVYQMKNVKIEE
jgi:predicted nucleotide-binding protein (sugar kinase/HSP70/actin superfamily)